MKYEDGQKVMIGDIVNLGPGAGRGVVVCLIEEGLVDEGCDLEDWSYLKKGVVFKSDVSGNVYFSKPDEDTVLIGRK